MIAKYAERSVQIAANQKYQHMSKQDALGAEWLQRDDATQACRDEEGLWNLFARGEAGFLWLSAEGLILRANDAWAELVGYRPEACIGRSLSRFHEQKSEGRDILQRFRNQETLQGYPASLRCRNGDIRKVLISSGSVSGDNQSVYTRCFIRDVASGQKMSELALQLSKERYWSLYDWEKKSREVLQIVRQSAGRNNLFAVAIAEMAKALKANRAFIIEFDGDAVCPVRYEYRSHVSVKPFTGLMPPWEFCPYLAIAAQKEMAVSADTYNDAVVGSNEEWRHFSREYDIRSIITVPVLHHDRLMQVLVFHKLEPDPWSEQEIFFVKGMAEHLAMVFYQEKIMQEQIQALQKKSDLLDARGQELQGHLDAIARYAALGQHESHASEAAKKRLRVLQELRRHAEAGLALVSDLRSLSSIAPVQE